MASDTIHAADKGAATESTAADSKPATGAPPAAGSEVKSAPADAEPVTTHLATEEKIAPVAREHSTVARAAGALDADDAREDILRGPNGEIYPTAEELRTLRLVRGKIEWIIYTIAIVEMVERFSYYGTTTICKSIEAEHDWSASPCRGRPRH